MKILGAGLAGLLAGVLNQDAYIFEPFERKKTHQALLRFRSPDIGEAVGVPFRKVQVYKGIWDEGPVPLSPKYISQYARKVSNKVAYRSICNIDSENRWIAPIDFQERLEDMCRGRISYKCDLNDKHTMPGATISTIPIQVLANMLSVNPPSFNVKDLPVKSIYVNKYRVPSCDAYMTIYFPALGTPIYRASISGDSLIVESIRPIKDVWIDVAKEALGLQDLDMSRELDNFEQVNGKISPINEAWRKEFILQATLDHNIYSLGRFATWRNLVLDDVYHDILRIKRFINKDRYDHHKDY
jgi:hypothetical protein